MNATDLALSVALWLGVALLATAVAHHIHHVLRGGHR